MRVYLAGQVAAGYARADDGDCVNPKEVVADADAILKRIEETE